MPKKLEKQLKAEGKKKGLNGDKLNAYVYGTLKKTGWIPKKRKSKKKSKSDK